MEFHEKLQALRKQHGLTQEELAQRLYVSRTAVSKWESGRGYPNIDSLKAIAACFSVTVDDLLSGDEVLTIAEQDSREKKDGWQDRVFGLLDLSVAVLLFARFFGQTVDGAVYEVSLFCLSAIPLYLRIVYAVVVVGLALFGLLTLVLHAYHGRLWMRYKRYLSLCLSVVGVVLFMVSPQPYAAMLLFLFLLIKVSLLLKMR